MRVLACSTPMEGVFAPLVPLATALQRAGHDVLVATGPNLEARVKSTGLAMRVAGPCPEEAAAEAVRHPAFAEGTEPWRLGATMFAHVLAPRKLPVLHELIEEFEPDLILQAPVDLAAPIAAASHGIPTVTYGAGLLLEPALMATMAAWVRPLWEQAGLESDEHAGMYRHRYLDPMPATLQPDLGPASAVATRIRPEVPGDPTESLPAWADRLGERPVVYVSLGTVPVFNRPETFRPLLDGLAEVDADVVVTVGHNNEPSSLGKVPSNVHVERWLSLNAILPRCQAVVCHAGAGTTLAALSYGLPLVLTPRGADQFPTATTLDRVGAGRMLAPPRVTPANVRDAVVEVLSNESYRVAARKLRDEIVLMPPADVVARELTG